MDESDDPENVSLAEEDYLTIFHIIHRLSRCESLDDLNRIIENDIMPLIRVELVGFVWANNDLIKSKSVVQGVIHGVHMGEQDIDKACLVEVGAYHKYLANVITQTNQMVTAIDVDYPREAFKNEIREFVRDHPRFEGARYTQANASLALIDRPDLEIGMGLTRIHPNEERFTLREVRLMELLHPSLIRTTKSIALNDQVKTYRALTEVLEDTGAPFALVNNTGRLLYCNTAFQNVVPVEPGKLVPKELREALEQLTASLNPDHPPETVMAPMAFYQSPDTIYRINVNQFHPQDNHGRPVWLLRLQSADDPCTTLHRKLQQAGLTPREVEAAVLIADGFVDADIAQRLFISDHTLKNHLKSIYGKLDVHSRTQLVAALRPPAAEQEV